MFPTPVNSNRNTQIADEIGDLIASSLKLTMGQNIFVGELPEANIDNIPLDDSLYFIEMPGIMGKDEDMYLDTETHLIDIWSTSNSTQTAYALLRRAYDILERKANYALANWYVFFSYANSTIRDESRGKEGNKLFSISFTIICRNLNNIS